MDDGNCEGVSVHAVNAAEKLARELGVQHGEILVIVKDGKPVDIHDKHKRKMPAREALGTGG